MFVNEITPTFTDCGNISRLQCLKASVLEYLVSDCWCFWGTFRRGGLDGGSLSLGEGFESLKPYGISSAFSALCFRLKM